MANVIDRNDLQNTINALANDGELSQNDVNFLINYLIANGSLTGTPRDMIQIRRGEEANLPNLAQGELGFTLDTKKLFVGGISGNVDIVEGLSNQIDEIVQVNIKNLPAPYVSAVGDGITNDTGAFKNAETYVNGLNRKVKLTIPAGTYLLSSGVHFHNEISIHGEPNSWIDYSGSGICFKLGKDGITENDFQYYKQFEVNGLSFKNGLNMQYGIYFNKFVTQGRVNKCIFETFGNQNGWAIYFDDDSWDGRVNDCRWSSVNDGVARNGITMYGRGNSRIIVTNTLLTSLTGLGTGIYLNGFNCIIDLCKVEGFSTNIRLGGLASKSVIRDSYFEKAGTPTGCIEIGSITGDNGELAVPIDILVDTCYVNTHVTASGPNSYFVKPTKSTDLIRQIKLTNNRINGYNDDGINNPIVFQNNLPGQYGNYASNNIGLNIDKLHSEGANILGWNGDDGVRREYNPLNEIDRYDDCFMGRISNHNTGRRVRKFDGTVVYQELVDPSFNTTISNNAHTVVKYFSDGRIGFGLTTIDAMFDFGGDIRASYMRFKEQQTPESVPNGSYFEGTDGNMYYKNLAGVLKQSTT